MKKLTLIADVLLISLSAGLFLPNSTINMAKYQSDNNKSLITEKDNITPEEVMDNQIPDELYDVGNEDQWSIMRKVGAFDLDVMEVANRKISRAKDFFVSRVTS